ncbi:MAG: hypothetical protein OXI05_03210 [Bacteroidota bacterium]|nr:hypothetical protein [Bacteroidota bacterium]MDE2644837.1 hypothetical protein [Bacteroidota bacterium]MXW32742.1 hypothetical protein [Rhodothermaceae bacterium]MYE64111.1 hypothetical protein [Rhodothermaceae bacterium]
MQDLQGGMSRKGAATKYGLSVERIRQIARQNGVPPTRRGRPKGARVERNRAIVQDIREGMSRKKVATKYGLGTNWVNEIARQNGILLPPPPMYAERNRAIAQDIREGMRCMEAAIKYGLTQPSIWRIAHAQGVDMSGRRGSAGHRERPRERDRERNRQIVQDLKAGMSRKEAATKYGLGRTRIGEIARQGEELTQIDLFQPSKPTSPRLHPEDG